MLADERARGHPRSMHIVIMETGRGVVFSGGLVTHVAGSVDHLPALPGRPAARAGIWLETKRARTVETTAA